MVSELFKMVFPILTFITGVIYGYNARDVLKYIKDEIIIYMKRNDTYDDDDNRQQP